MSSGITPGHSGAPIIDSEDNNKVIGIGSGGLSNIGFQRVNWAVPALQTNKVNYHNIGQVPLDNLLNSLVDLIFSLSVMCLFVD